MKALSILFAACTVLSAQDSARTVRPISVERKLALIIGNSAYTAAPLKNPRNDAAAMEQTLRKLGFDEVRTYRDLDLARMEAAVDEFRTRLTPGSLAFFYYSGHGVQVNSSNYLLPVDFAARSESEVKYKAFPASLVQDKLEESGARLRVIVLDACRNNPYRFKRDALGGLAGMTVNAEGTLIAFATGDNNTADDNQAAANGLYTTHLIPALLTPGLPLHEVFRKAKQDVFLASKRSQNPSIYENIVGEYYLMRSAAPPAVLPRPRLEAADEAWNLIRNSQSADDFEEFASAFPSSELAATARLRARQLRRTATGAAPAAPAVIPTTIPTASPQPGKTKVNPKDGLTYVWIPPGDFIMGCSGNDSECDGNETPPHQVRITRGFWLGQTEVTQSAWSRVMGRNPSRFKKAENPVEQASWEEASKYCGAVGMRLPTEAEWEYAARAGTLGARYGDIDRVAWYRANSRSETHPVKSKEPNAWGLYDMLGNVYEWTSGWYGDYAATPVSDPSGPAFGVGLTLRGGSWDAPARGVRVSHRVRLGPGGRNNFIGLRCAGE